MANSVLLIKERLLIGRPTKTVRLEGIEIVGLFFACITASHRVHRLAISNRDSLTCIELV